MEELNLTGPQLIIFLFFCIALLRFIWSVEPRNTSEVNYRRSDLNVSEVANIGKLEHIREKRRSSWRKLIP